MEVPKSCSEYTVAVVLEGSSFTVVPGDLLTKQGDRVFFQNLTDSAVTVLFPDESLFGKAVVAKLNPNAETSGTVESRRSADDYLIVGSEAQGSYPYAVYYHGRKEFAHRSAMPRIIVVR